MIPLLCLAGTQGERSQGLQGQPHVSDYGRYYGEGVGLTVIFLCLALCPACRCVHTYSHACECVCVSACTRGGIQPLSPGSWPATNVLLLRMPAGASLPPPPRSTRAARPPSLPLARGALRSGCLVLEAVQRQPRRWLSGRAAEGSRGARSDGRTLPPRGRRLPWKYFSSFASAVTAPMVTQAPSHGRWGCPPTSGGRLEGAESWPARFGAGGGAAGQGWGTSGWTCVNRPRPASFQPGVELWGPLQAGGLGNGRTGLGGTRLH